MIRSTWRKGRRLRRRGGLGWLWRLRRGTGRGWQVTPCLAWLGTCGALLAGEEARIKAEMAQQDPEYNFSFLKIAEIVGIAPDSTICL